MVVSSVAVPSFALPMRLKPLELAFIRIPLHINLFARVNPISNTLKLHYFFGIDFPERRNDLSIMHKPCRIRNDFAMPIHLSLYPKLPSILAHYHMRHLHSHIHQPLILPHLLHYPLLHIYNITLISLLRISSFIFRKFQFVCSCSICSTRS